MKHVCSVCFLEVCLHVKVYQTCSYAKCVMFGQRIIGVKRQLIQKSNYIFITPYNLEELGHSYYIGLKQLYIYIYIQEFIANSNCVMCARSDRVVKPWYFTMLKSEASWFDTTVCFCMLKLALSVCIPTPLYGYPIK